MIYFLWSYDDFYFFQESVIEYSKIPPFHPGRILKKEYLELFQISQTELASALGTTFRTINEIVNEKRNISPEMALKLSRYFSTDIELWLSLQNKFDVYKIYVKKHESIDKIKPMKRKRKIKSQ